MAARQQHKRRFGYHCQWRVSDCCNLQRGSRSKLISHLFYNFIINPSVAALSNPFQRGSRGWGVFIYGNHATRWENSTSWWGCLCDVCFASMKPSEREFFVPAGTHLAVKLLTGTPLFGFRRDRHNTRRQVLIKPRSIRQRYGRQSKNYNLELYFLARPARRIMQIKGQAEISIPTSISTCPRIQTDGRTDGRTRLNGSPS